MKTPKFCPECGAKITEGAKFCGECGDKLFVKKETKKTIIGLVGWIFVFLGVVIITFNIFLLATGLMIHHGVIDLRHALEFIFLIGFGVWCIFIGILILLKAWRKKNIIRWVGGIHVFLGAVIITFSIFLLANGLILEFMVVFAFGAHYILVAGWILLYLLWKYHAEQLKSRKRFS